MMDSHNVGRGNPSIKHALSQISARTLVIGIDTDILFPAKEQKFLAEHIPEARYREITSLYGHDGFLVEFDQLDSILKKFYYENETSSVLAEAEQN
jgi:homoserine O-acetyltransferase